MAWQLTGRKPLHEAIMTYCQLDPHKQTSVKFYSRYTKFFWEKAFENAICKLSAILFRLEFIVAQWQHYMAT